MNISKAEQRVLHALAQGGLIQYERDSSGHITSAICFNRDGYRLLDCTLDVFKKLKKRRFIISRSGSPYRITPLGLNAVRPQFDNQ